jgi:hypothetical protein
VVPSFFSASRSSAAQRTAACCSVSIDVGAQGLLELRLPGQTADLASRRPTELPQDGRDEVLQHRAVARAEDLDRLRQACAATTELTPTSERNRSML